MFVTLCEQLKVNVRIIQSVIFTKYFQTKTYKYVLKYSVPHWCIFMRILITSGT